MTDFAKAASELEWFGAKLRGIMDVADELRRVGSLQQAGDEAQARLDRLNAEHAEKLDAHAANHKQLDATLAATKQRGLDTIQDIARQTSDAERGLEAKRAEGDAILSTARQQAALAAEDIIRDANASIVGARNDLAALNAELTQKRTEASDIDDRVLAARSTLAELEHQRAEWHAKLAR